MAPGSPHPRPEDSAHRHLPFTRAPTGGAEVLDTFKATATDLDTSLYFVVDPDESLWGDYPFNLVEPCVLSFRLNEKPHASGMLPALNMAAKEPMIMRGSTVVGFIGDDHRFRTPGWDAAIEDYLEAHPGIAYADDMSRGQSLPTQWFISRQIVDVFGMGHPSLRHLFIDDYWKALGTAAGCLYYMPDIQIEHVHPFAGKAPMDEGYLRVNSEATKQHDQEAFMAWYNTDMAADIEKLRGIV